MANPWFTAAFPLLLISFAPTCPASPPIVATEGGLTVAVVFPSASTARVVVAREGEKRQQSREFEFPRDANYGAPWVELVEVKSPQSFVLHIRTRQTCGPGIHRFTFAYRGADWLVAGLDREESACPESGGPAPAWSASYNFLTGQVRRVEFANGRAGKPTLERKQFPRFKLTDFAPLDPSFAQ